ncbi:MAG: ABC transporter ATP-binding protein [Acholeplasmataceae bacterium]|nr:ABC transporter ATP-binding protein [Acholeplasmataceae bacterium]
MNILEVRNLRKEYPKFILNDVSFVIPKGYIMGFIGENGAGKTTTLKAMLNVISKDGGTVDIFGKNMDENEIEIKKDIAFMPGNAFYPKRKIKDITRVFRRFYSNFDEEIYQEYLKKFNLDQDKKIDELSQGMSLKYSIALALSHHAKLIILDEPTSGLDPVARDSLLEIFQSIIEEGEISILFSTHITTDLEKCADYITFIQNGEIIESLSKEDLIAKYRLVNGSLGSLSSIETDLISFKKNAFGFTGLIKTDQLKENDKIKIGIPSLDDIMIYYAERGVAL